MKLQMNVPVLEEFDRELERLRTAQLPSLLVAGNPEPFGEETEAAERLGWVDLPLRADELLDQIDALREELTEQGLNSITLTGMGGSSLAPEVMAEIAGVNLEIVDSTDPNQVAEAIGTDLDHTVLIVASKSGSTVETDAIRRAYVAAFETVGIDPATRLIAITDPGSDLDRLATDEGYLRVFHTDPTVGGRFSALSAFGLVPAGLAGVDVRTIVADAVAALPDFGVDSDDNPALQFGTWLGIGHARATEKLVLAETAPGLSGLSKWIEQLVAESTGKDGQGILPVVVNGPDDIGFADARADALLCTLGPATEAVAPSAFTANIDGNLGELFLFWEFATAIAGYSIGVDPFDQPDVESAKLHTRALLDSTAEVRKEDPVIREGEIEVYGNVGEAHDLSGAIAELFAQVDEYGYVGIQVFLDRIADAEAESLRSLVSSHVGVQTTFGFGPRYLHSTGQYHKGGHPNGVFLQITGEARTEILVPGRQYGFGRLQAAQALGDAAALSDKGRSVLRVHLLNRHRGLEQLHDVIAGIEPGHHYGID